jgi:mono/diheme cytochrome c family protein
VKFSWSVYVLWLLAILLPAPASAQQSADGESIERGESVLNAAGCVACHTRPESSATGTAAAQQVDPQLAGGRALETPFGTFYSPNITPDKEHGIGRRSADDLWRALAQGEGPGGVHFYPVFPFPSCAAMERSNADDLYHYLTSTYARAESSVATTP